MGTYQLERSQSSAAVKRDVKPMLNRSYSTANLSRWTGKRYNASFHANSPSYYHGRYSVIYPSSRYSSNIRCSDEYWFRYFYRVTPPLHRPLNCSYFPPSYYGSNLKPFGRSSLYRQAYYPSSYYVNYDTYPYRYSRY